MINAQSLAFGAACDYNFALLVPASYRTSADDSVENHAKIVIKLIFKYLSSFGTRQE